MAISRRKFLQTAGAAGVAACASSLLVPRSWGDSSTGNSSPAKKLNVLMILVDDLRPQLRCYGKPFMVTPNLDKLAGESMVFDRHYCPQALCAPSRISLLSGCRPDTTGIYDLNTPLVSKHPEILTIPRLFKQQGYTTVSYGKFYHHMEDDPTAWSRPPVGFTGQTQGRGYVLPENIALLSGKNPKAAPFEKADVPDNAYMDGAMADEAVKLLGEVKSQPFFVGLGFHKPHLPFCAPAKYWDLYGPEVIQLPGSRDKPKDAPQIAMQSFGELRSYAGIPNKDQVSDDLARQLIHGYYAGVSYTDAQIGRVLAELDRLGLRDSTVVLLTADHGWLLEEHGLWCKHCNFEEAKRVPLMIRAPGGTPGQRCSALTEHTDLYGTLCDLTGYATPGHVEGTSLVPLLRDPTRSWKSAAFSQYPRTRAMGYTMRTDRYRFTRWGREAAAPLELYDYQADPQGAVNVAGVPENRDLVRNLSEQLTAGWKATQAQVQPGPKS